MTAAHALQVHPLAVVKLRDHARLLPLAKQYVEETDPNDHVCTVSDFVEQYEVQTVLDPQELLSLLCEARDALPKLCEGQGCVCTDDHAIMGANRHCDGHGSLDYPRPTL